MATGIPVPNEVREAAVADYRTSGDTLLQVAARHGISKASLSRWLSPNPSQRRDRRFHWEEDEVAYTGGWEIRGGVRYPLLPERRSA